jgi:hypothetical protein
MRATPQHTHCPVCDRPVYDGQHPDAPCVLGHQVGCKWWPCEDELCESHDQPKRAATNAREATGEERDAALETPLCERCFHPVHDGLCAYGNAGLYCPCGSE